MQKHLVPLLCLTLVLSTTGFANFVALIPEFADLWSLSNSEAGWISGILLVGYVIAVPILAGATDRVDAKRVYLLSAVIGVISAFGFAFFAEGFWSGLTFRFLYGIAMAGTYIPGLQILNDRLDEPKRIRAVPWYTASFGLGTGASYILTGYLIGVLEWPFVFITAGGLQIVCFMLILTLVPTQKKTPTENDTKRHLLDFRPVIANRPAFAYIVGHAGHAFELFAFRAWIVAFLVFAAILSGADASRAEIGTYVAVYSVVGMATSILGAQVALYTNRSHTITIIMAISFLAGTALGFLLGLPFLIVVAAAGVYSGLIMTDSASLTAGIVATAQERLRGATLAMQQVIGFSGGAIGTVVVGWVLDLSGGQQSHLAWILACLTIAAGSLMGVIGMRVVMGLASHSTNHSVSTK